MKDERLFVENGQQKRAIKGGARFVRKNFFNDGSEGFFVVSDGENLSDEKRDKLKSQFGLGAFEDKVSRENLNREWVRVLLEGDNLDALRLAKKCGLPTSPDVLEKMFRKWRTDSPLEYRLNWKYLCDYLPEFNERFGKEAFVSLCNEHALMGDMRSAIEHERVSMAGYEAEYLHFCYSHRIPAARRGEREVAV